MATDLSTKEFQFAVIAASTTEDVLTLDNRRDYTLIHNGLDVDGNAATTSIFMANDAASDADLSASTNKLVLSDGRVVTIGPGLSSVRFKTASGSPTFQVIRNPEYQGAY